MGSGYSIATWMPTLKFASLISSPYSDPPHYVERLTLGDNQISDISALSGLTALRSLNLDGNQIGDISALVANSGLGPRDQVWMRRNNPTNAEALSSQIQELEARGVTVNR